MRLLEPPWDRACRHRALGTMSGLWIQLLLNTHFHKSVMPLKNLRATGSLTDMALSLTSLSPMEAQALPS